MKRGTMFGRDESKKKKPSPIPRNPLTNLNTISRSTSSNSSSSLSVEAPPKGCLSFFLPSSSSSSTSRTTQKPKSLLPKTPKSAPISRPSKPKSKLPTPKIPEKPLLQKSKSKSSTPSLRRNDKNPLKPSHLKPPSKEVVKEEHFQKKQQQGQWRMNTGEPLDHNLFSFGIKSLDDSRNVTPLSKIGCGSGLVAMEENSIDDSKTSTTPPVQASISPEIQCGSSMSSMTPTCFGAGHVLSGVSDKRKCRPRGILTVGEELELGFCKTRVSDADADSDDECLFLNKSRVSLIPAPSEASMHWLLSPCKEEDDMQCSLDRSSPELRKLMGPTPFHSLSSPSSADGFSQDACGSRNTGSSMKRACFISPPSGLTASPSPSVFQISPSDHLVYCSSPSFSANATTSCKAVFSKEDRGYRYEYATENSPLSVDSMGSQNVIRTPQSDSSLDRPIGFSWLKNAVDEGHQEYRFELDSMAEMLRKTNLSPENRTSRWDPADVLPLPGFSFQFANSASPSNFIDQIDHQKTSNDRFWQVSGSSFGNVSQSQTRISWREGLVSRIFDMDELDCCRWSSDEEIDVNCCVNDQSNLDIGCKLDKSIENDPTLISASKSPEILFKEPKIDVRSKGKSKRDSPCQIPNSCAESISTEGGGLIASGDSDWTLCYKNQLFRE